MKDLIRMTIEKADLTTLNFLATYTFSQPFTAHMLDLLEMIIERGDLATLRTLEMDTFSQPHTKDPQFDYLRASTKIADKRARKEYFRQHRISSEQNRTSKERLPKVMRCLDLLAFP